MKRDKSTSDGISTKRRDAEAVRDRVDRAGERGVQREGGRIEIDRERQG